MVEGTLGGRVEQRAGMNVASSKGRDRCCFVTPFGRSRALLGELELSPCVLVLILDKVKRRVERAAKFFLDCDRGFTNHGRIKLPELLFLCKRVCGREPGG